MNINLVKSVILCVVLLLLQVVVLNHVHLFGVATPLLYIYVVMIVPRNFPRWALLLVGFVMGLFVDLFSNTPGMSAAALTFLGLVQPYVLSPFLGRDVPDDFTPELHQMGIVKFGSYSLLMSLAFSLVYFTIEAFLIFDWLFWLGCVLGSTLLTFIFILVIENFRSK